MPIIKIDVKEIRRGVQYTDRHTGMVKTVFPYSGSIEGYPEGYFDDPGPHQWPHQPPFGTEERSTLALQFAAAALPKKPNEAR